MNKILIKKIDLQKEKLWREKEREEARKRKATIEELKAARAKQIEDIRVAQAISLQRDEEAFNKVKKSLFNIRNKN